MAMTSPVHHLPDHPGRVRSARPSAVVALGASRRDPRADRARGRRGRRPTPRSPRGWVCMSTPSATGAAGSPPTGMDGLADLPRSGRPPVFAAGAVAEVKALACTLPAETGLPLSRWSAQDLAAEAVTRGITETISAVHRAPLAGRRCDQAVAAPVLDLPPRPGLRRQGRPGARPVRPRWHGQPLGPDEYVISADEKSQLQALRRRHRGPAARARDGPAGSSSSTAAAAPWPTSPPTTSTTPRVIGRSPPRPGSNRSATSSPRS